MSTELIDLVNEEETCLADMSYFFLIGLLVKLGCMSFVCFRFISTKEKI